MPFLMLCFRCYDFFPSPFFDVVRGYHITTLDFIKWHSQQLLPASSQLVVTFQWTLKHLIQPILLTGLDMTPPPISVFPVRFPSRFPRKIQTHSLLNIQTLYSPIYRQTVYYHQSTITCLAHVGTLCQCSQFLCRQLSLTSLLHFFLRLPAQIQYYSHEAHSS